MSFEGTDSEESTSSLSEVSSLDDDFDGMHLESESSDEEMAVDEVNSSGWYEIEPEPDAEFVEDYGLVEEVVSTSEDNTINPIDCYRHSLRTKLLILWFVKLIAMRSNIYKLMRLADDRNFVNGNQPTIKRCGSSLVSLLRWDWYKCPN